MTEPTPDLSEIPDSNRFEVVFFAEGVVDRSNETAETTDDEGEDQ